MIYRNFISGAATLGLAAAYAIPASDGFPNPDNQQLMQIQTTAGGSLSNAKPPIELSEEGVANFQLIAFNEQFEVAFFSSLIENITNNVEGYQSAPGMSDTAEILEILQTVKAVSHSVDMTTFHKTLTPCSKKSFT